MGFKARKSTAGPVKTSISWSELNTSTPPESHPVWEQIRQQVKYSDIQELVTGRFGAEFLVGPITLDGHLDLDGHRLVVQGDLHVTGTISGDMGDALFVLGTLRCENFACGADVVITNELVVEGALYGNYESGVTYARTARGQLWLHGNHAFELAGSNFVHETDLTQYPPKENYMDETPFLTPTAINLAFISPRQYWQGEGDGPEPRDWLAALKENDVAR